VCWRLVVASAGGPVEATGFTLRGVRSIDWRSVVVVDESYRVVGLMTTTL
jgi:hypothetical protein